MNGCRFALERRADGAIIGGAAITPFAGGFELGYWLGKECVGRVRLGVKGDWDGVYRWDAGTNTGEARTLGEAKRQVEEKVLLGLIQLPLF